MFHYFLLVGDERIKQKLVPTGAETVVEIWLDIPIVSSEPESPSLTSNIKQEHTTKPPPDELVIYKIEKQEAPTLPISIKMEEPLIINESAEVESQPELAEIPYEAQEMKSDAVPKSSQGCLNDISDIFKDAAPAKIAAPGKIGIVKLKTTSVQPKKTLVRCLDSNGKIVFVELQVDPNNPKNIKIIKTPTVIASAQTPLSQAKSSNLTPLKMSTPTEPERHTTAPVTNILSNTSNSPNQITSSNPLTSTISTANPKPLMYKSNANLSGLNAVGSKSLLENKKVFIIKSSTLPNLSSTNPPPLVRISNPNKFVLASSAANLKVVMQPTSKANETRNVTVNSTNVVMKNGKFTVLDKSHPKPKQESLLKPQISLLKPVYHQKPLSDASTTKSILITKPFSILGGRSRKQTLLNQSAAKRDYHKEFQTIFLRHHFHTIRSAVEYLLRNTPLINTLCSRPDFHAAFPFVAESHEKFSSFPFPKRRLNEVGTHTHEQPIENLIFFYHLQWYRAKFVLRMLQQHPDLKSQLSWLTREVIIFGRRFGYTPANAFTVHKQLQSNENQLKDMIKQHIKAEQLKNVTITYNNKIKDFLQKYDDLTSTCAIPSTGSLEFVDVDGDETPNVEVKTNPTQVGGDKLVLDVNKIIQSGGQLVNDVCHDIQISLDKEEIVDGWFSCEFY